MKNIMIIMVIGIVIALNSSCEQQNFEPLLTTENGAGTLTTFKAYTLDSMVSLPDSAYGRVVFWQGLDGTTLAQLSLYNVDEEVSFPSAIFSGNMADASPTALMTLYNVENTGEGYDFGEFSTAKYFVISDLDFYDSLDELDAYVAIQRSDMDPTIICAGNIGVNAEPIEEN